MKAIGIRELKAHLSQYLRDVQSGEVILVTNRGRVVAELRQPGSHLAPSSAIDMALQRLAATQRLRVGEPQTSQAYTCSPIRAPAGTSDALLSEERDER